MKELQIILDNGHAKNTAGKCSPDKSFYEWKFNREIAIALEQKLKSDGYSVHRIVTEDIEDIPLSERVKRANNICDKYGAKNCIFISIHANASGNTWSNASGSCVFVAKQSSQLSKELAQLFYAEVTQAGFAGNRCVPQQKYWMENFYVIKNTKCPAILTENLFYTNKADLAILQTSEGKEKIVAMHEKAIKNYISKFFQK